MKPQVSFSTHRAGVKHTWGRCDELKTWNKLRNAGSRGNTEKAQKVDNKVKFCWAVK